MFFLPFVLELSFLSFSSAETVNHYPCSCIECFAKDACSLADQKDLSISFMLKLIYEHGLVTQHEVNLTNSRNNKTFNNTCFIYRLTLTAAYLFDFEAPADVPDCSDNGCLPCYKNLKNIKSWRQLNNSYATCNQEFDAQIDTFERLLNAFKEILFRGVKNQLDAKDFVLPDCPQQSVLSVTNMIEIYLETIAVVFRCSLVDVDGGGTIDQNSLISSGNDSSVSIIKYWNGTVNNDSIFSYGNVYNASLINFQIEMKEIDKSTNGSTFFSKNSNLSVSLNYGKGVLFDEQSFSQSTNKNISLLNELLSLRIVVMFQFTNVLSTYKYDPCNDVACSQEIAKCSMYWDKLYALKSKLISSMQRYMLGCRNCALENNSFSAVNCSSQESLLKLIVSEEANRRWLKRIFVEAIGCNPENLTCIDRKKRDIPVEIFLLISQSMKLILGCENCNETCISDSCQVNLALPITSKYKVVTDVMKMMNSCIMDFQNENTSYLENSTLSSINIPENLRMKMGGILKRFFDFHIALKLVKMLMSLKEVNKNNTTQKYFGEEVTKAESECISILQLQNPACSPYLYKMQILTFLHVLTNLLECGNQDVFTCQVDLINQLNKNCIFNSKNGDIVGNDAKLIDLSFVLAVIFFQRCSFSNVESDFFTLLMQCSYYRIVLGKKENVFGSMEGVELLSKLQLLMPTLFTTNNLGSEMVYKLYQVLKCSDNCPLNYVFCLEKNKCLQKWESCEVKRESMEVFILPQMYSNMTFSQTWLVDFLSNESIILLNQRNIYEENGFWQYKYGDHWNDLSSIPLNAGVKLGSNSQVRYKTLSPQYGLRLLYYIIDNSKKTVGDIILTSDFKNVKIAAMFIHPIAFNSNFSVLSNLKVYKLNENEYWNKGILLNEIVYLHSPFNFNLHPIPNEYTNKIPSFYLNSFYQNLEKFELSRPVGIITENFKDFGRLEIEVQTQYGLQSFDSQQKKYFSLDYNNSKLVFRPKENFHGTLNISIKFCNCFSDDKTIESKIITLMIIVYPINDSSVNPTRMLYLPPIGFNFTDEPNNGFTITQLVMFTKAYNVEKFNNIGIVVFKLPENKYGIWQYLKDDKWEDITVNNTLDIFNVNYGTLAIKTVLNLFYLNSYERIRFNLNGDILWKISDAYQLAFLGFSFWNNQENVSTGVQNIPLSQILPTNYYSMPILGIQLRRGCDNATGSMKRYDKCGICGGDGFKCLGCDGMINSGAIIDICGICTGGATNITYNSVKDCAGTCGESDLDDCGICQIKKFRRNFKDCSGVCFGKASVDKCGVCSGGNTKKKENSNLDACGVCNGNNLTCMGCDNVPNSDKKKDLCGQCLKITDPLYNTGCFKISYVKPLSASSAGNETITVIGAGLVSNVVCMFTNATHIFYAPTKEFKVSSQLEIISPAMPPGIYNFSCFSKNITYQLKSLFFVYDSSSLKIFGVKPTKLPISTNASVEVTGEGFLNTGEVECLVLMEGVVQNLPAVVIDSSTVLCQLLPIEKSMEVQLSVFFVKKTWGVPEFLSNLPKIDLMFFAPPPLLLSAIFSDDYQKIYLTFTKWASFKGLSCQEIFTDTTAASFGHNFECGFTSLNILQVYLSVNSFIKPGDSISINNNSIVVPFQRFADPMPASDVILLSPNTSLLVPESVLSGNAILGACDNLELSGRKSTGAGKRSMVYEWGVEFSESVNVKLLTYNTTNGLKLLKNKLVLLSEENTILLPPYVLSLKTTAEFVEYNFTLVVTNFLNQRSSLKYLTVFRTNNVLPIVKINGGFVQSFRASKLNKLEAIARMPECSEAAPDIIFSWELDATLTSDSTLELDSKSRNKSTLYLFPGTLKSGQTYIFILSVSMKLNSSISTIVRVEVNVLSSPLQAIINGGNKRLVSSKENFILDGFLSSDPDKGNEDVTYEWTCVDSNLVGCFIFNSSTNKYTRFEIKPEPTVVIAQNTLQGKQSYIFTLHYHKGFRFSEASVEVFIDEGFPPVVKILPQSNQKEDVTNNVFIRGEVMSSVGNVHIWFECLASADYAYINLSQPGVLLSEKETKMISKGKFNVALAFVKNVLLSGASYKFMLKAESEGGIGFAEVILITNSAPSIGNLKSNVIEGTALTTEFTLSATEGWEDAIGDLPLLFSFGYNDLMFEKHYLTSPSFENQVTVKLPSGNGQNNELSVFVEVADIFGAKSKAFITLVVAPPPFINSAVIRDMKSSIDIAIASDDLSSALGNIVSTLSTFSNVNSDMNATEQKDVDLVAVAISDFKENVTKSILELATNVQDVETQNVIIYSLSKMTSGGRNFNDYTKYEVATKLFTIVRRQIGAAVANNVRRRRSAEVYSNIAKSSDEVEHILQSYVNIITPKDVTNSSMVLKKTFTDITTDLIASMCRTTTYGLPALVAKSELVNLQVVKKNFAGISNKSLNLGCDVNCTKPTYAMLGEYLQSTYENWSCGTDACSGTCIGSAQFKNDLFSSDAARNVITDIVLLLLINPVTYTVISTGLLSSPVEIDLPLTSPLCPDCFYECEMFDTLRNEWSKSSCLSNQQVKVLNGSLHTTCICYRLGILSVISIELSDLSINNNSVSNRTEPSNFANVQIKFENNYTAVLARVTKVSLENSVANSIAEKMAIDVWRIRKMTCSNGSILASFQFLPLDEALSQNALLTLNDDLKRFSDLITNGELSVSLSDGFQLTLDRTFFKAQYNIIVKNVSEHEDKHPEVAAIIAGSVVGGLAFLILVIYLIKKFKILSLAHIV